MARPCSEARWRRALRRCGAVPRVAATQRCAASRKGVSHLGCHAWAVRLGRLTRCPPIETGDPRRPVSSTYLLLGSRVVRPHPLTTSLQTLRIRPSLRPHLRKPWCRRRRRRGAAGGPGLTRRRRPLRGGPVDRVPPMGGDPGDSLMFPRPSRQRVALRSERPDGLGLRRPRPPLSATAPSDSA